MDLVTGHGKGTGGFGTVGRNLWRVRATLGKFVGGAGASKGALGEGRDLRRLAAGRRDPSCKRHSSGKLHPQARSCRWEWTSPGKALFYITLPYKNWEAQ